MSMHCGKLQPQALAMFFAATITLSGTGCEPPLPVASYNGTSFAQRLQPGALKVHRASLPDEFYQDIGTVKITCRGEAQQPGESPGSVAREGTGGCSLKAAMELARWEAAQAGAHGLHTISTTPGGNGNLVLLTATAFRYTSAPPPPSAAAPLPPPAAVAVAPPPPPPVEETPPAEAAPPPPPPARPAAALASMPPLRTAGPLSRQAAPPIARPVPAAPQIPVAPTASRPLPVAPPPVAVAPPPVARPVPAVPPSPAAFAPSAAPPLAVPPPVAAPPIVRPTQLDFVPSTAAPPPAAVAEKRPLVIVPPPAEGTLIPPPPPGSTSANTLLPAEERLKRLKELRDKGMIPAQIYERRRKEILAGH